LEHTVAKRGNASPLILTPTLVCKAVHFLVYEGESCLCTNNGLCNGMEEGWEFFNGKEFVVL